MNSAGLEIATFTDTLMIPSKISTGVIVTPKPNDTLNADDGEGPVTEYKGQCRAGRRRQKKDGDERQHKAAHGQRDRDQKPVLKGQQAFVLCKHRITKDKVLKG